MAMRRVSFDVRQSVEIVPFERSEEGAQDIVVLLVALVLAAVVVRQERAPAQLKARAVRQRMVDDGPLVHRAALELLEERRLSVTGVARDDDEREFAREHRRHEVAVERGLDISLLADNVETACARIAVLALAVDRQQVADVRVRVRRDR